MTTISSLTLPMTFDLTDRKALTRQEKIEVEGASFLTKNDSAYWWNRIAGSHEYKNLSLKDFSYQNLTRNQKRYVHQNILGLAAKYILTGNRHFIEIAVEAREKLFDGSSSIEELDRDYTVFTTLVDRLSRRHVKLTVLRCQLARSFQSGQSPSIVAIARKAEKVLSDIGARGTNKNRVFQVEQSSGRIFVRLEGVKAETSEQFLSADSSPEKTIKPLSPRITRELAQEVEYYRGLVESKTLGVMDEQRLQSQYVSIVKKALVSCRNLLIGTGRPDLIYENNTRRALP